MIQELRVTARRRIPPDPAGTFVALSRIGYTLEEAIADLIDNSIDARARNVSIRLLRGDRSLNKVVIVDDGAGIAPRRLDNAMKFAGAVAHKQGDLGKFNIGLKTASFSFGNSVSVLTKHSSGLGGRRWTLSGVRDGWLLDEINVDDVRRYFQRDWGLPETRSGTIVVWEDLPAERRAIGRVDSFLADFFKSAQVHLGLHFHRFISSGRLSISIAAASEDAAQEPGPPRLVAALDPFGYSKSGKRSYPKSFSARVEGVGTLEAVAHIWPRKSASPEYKLGGRVAQRQGLYFYRADRLIQAGGWNGWQGDAEPHLSLARVSIDLPPKFDDAFGLNVQKTRIIAPPTFLDALADARSGDSTLADYIREAQEVYRTRPIKPDLQAGPVPGRGIPSHLRRQLRAGIQGNGTRVRFVWRSFEPDEVFRLDRDNSTVILNSRLKSRLGGRAAEAFAKGAIFLLLEPYFDRERLRESDKARLARANSALAVALSDASG